MSPRPARCCALCGKRAYSEPSLVMGREQLIRWAQANGVKLAKPNMPDLHLGCAGALRRELAERLMPLVHS